MRMIIGENDADASSGEIIEIRNPYDGSLIDTVPNATREDAEQAVTHAVTAQKQWKKVPIHVKTGLVKRFLQLVEEKREELARTLSLESGKNITEARIEINNIFTAWNAFSEKIKHKYDEVIPNGCEAGHDNNIVITRREPLGVVVCIIPFNFPCNLFNQKVAPALLCGNTVIVKPASSNPLTVCTLVGLLREAGVPAGVVQVVTGSGDHIGTYLSENDRVSAITLTGSSAVGTTVAQTAARSLKKVALELGGNDAFIVLEDADFELAVTEAVKARFFNAGQICCAPKRFIIHESLYSRFLQEAVSRASKIKAGNPQDESTQLGTLISEAAAKTVMEQIEHTVSQGARIALGGRRNGAFIEPTILADVPRDADIMHDMEVFGPVMPVTSFRTEEEALELANDTIYGLGGSVFTSNMKKAMYFVGELECGSVVVNGSSYFRSFEMPFGGCKHSGLGTEGVYSTFDELTRIKCVGLKGII